MSAQIRANAYVAENSSIWPLRQRLFSPRQPFILPAQEFQEQWKLGDNFWTRYGSNKRADGVVTTSYKCKLLKHRKSLGPLPAKAGDSSKKRRITSVFQPVDCEARLLVINDTANGSVTVQMHPDFNTHSAGHCIGDADDFSLCSRAAEFIKEEAQKPYASKDIADALPQIIARATSPCRATALGLGRITARAVWNKGWKERLVAAAPPSSLAEDARQSLAELEAAGYTAKRFFIETTAEDVPEGFAFATPRGLQTLASSSYLVLLDSTHKTNIYDWRLFTVMVRNSNGSWIPAGQFYVSVENANAVSAGLQTLRDMVSLGGFGTWQPRYFLIDQSHVEKNGIHQTFRGMQAGEEEVYVKFCMVHLIRTLMRRTSTHPKTFRTMLHALNKTTRIGARQLVEEAIAGAPPLIGTYLDNYWNRASDIESWSMAARQHSPILLQVTSTNALESYHRLVKGPGKCTKRCSLLKACRALVKVNNQRWLEADRTATTFRTKALKHLNAYPEIGKFPYPIQRLLIDQYMAVEKRIAKAKPIPELQGECHCLFARKYLLPCKHVFHADSCSDTRILTPELWNSYIIMFEESGYEVYEGKEKVTVPVVLPEIDRARDSRKRKVKAAGEEIMNFYFRLEDQIADQDPLAAGKLDNFIADLQSFTTSNTVYTFHL